MMTHQMLYLLIPYLEVLADKPSIATSSKNEVKISSIKRNHSSYTIFLGNKISKTDYKTALYSSLISKILTCKINRKASKQAIIPHFDISITHKVQFKTTTSMGCYLKNILITTTTTTTTKLGQPFFPRKLGQARDETQKK